MTIQSTSRSLGFTLIELMVGVSVMLLLITYGWVNFVSANERQQLIASGKMIASELRLAQKQATSGEKPTSGSCSLEPFKGVQIRATNSSTIVKEVVCGDLNNVFQELNEVALPSSITLSSDSDDFLVFFRTLSEGVTFGPGVVAPMITIILEKDGMNQQYSIEVFSSGDIRDQLEAISGGGGGGPPPPPQGFDP